MKTLKFGYYFKKFKEFISQFKLLLVFFVFFFFLLNAFFSFISNEIPAKIIERQELIVHEEISIIDLVIKTDFASTYEDLLVLRDSDEFSRYIADNSNENLQEVQGLFYRIANNKPEFYNIRYLGLDGKEVIRVNNTSNGTVIVGNVDLQDKSMQYYYYYIANLEDKLYMSNLDLNMENGVYIEPYEPVIRFIVPIYNSLDVKTGYLVINYNPYQILEVFSKYDESDYTNIRLGLLSNNILYQFHRDSSENYSLEIVANPNEVYPESNVNITELITIDLSEEIAQGISDNSSQLKIFAYVDIENVLLENAGIFYNNRVIIIILSDLLVFFVFFYIGFMLKKRFDDRILLNANTYLSDTNTDSVLILDEDLEVYYSNNTLNYIYKYSEAELSSLKPFKNIIDLINYNHETKEYEDFIWSKTKSDINILSYLKISEIMSINNKIKYYVSVLNNPDFDTRTILKNIPDNNNPECFSDIIREISALYKSQKIIVDSTLIFLVKIDYTVKGSYTINQNQVQFELFEEIRSKLPDTYNLAIPSKDYLLIHINAGIDHNTNYYHNILVKLLDNFKYSQADNLSLSYIISSDFAKSKSDSFEGIIFNVFAAMEFSKKIVIRKYLPYADNMRDILRRDSLIREQLDNGFDNDEFYMNYHIQQSLTTEEFTGVEALLRWNNKKLGIIPPNDFIPIIEDSYYINSLSLMVVKKVIKDFEPFANDIPEDFRVSINLTSYDFHNDMIFEEIVNVIEKSKLSSHNFCFEITESGYLENSMKINNLIDYLHSKGIIVAIDDFGRGFSSLSSLITINADKVKVDRAFIKDYPESDDGLMHRTIANLVKTLGMTIIVEGTETEEQVALAKSTKCHEHQGYFVSKPLSFDDFYKKFFDKIINKK